MLNRSESAQTTTATNEHFEVIYRHEDQKVPLVSVIISLYNYREFIVECLESVKSQTLQQLDLVIVDDCSRDDSLDLTKRWVRRFADRFNKILLIHHKVNLGLATARNTAINACRTKYVFILDADNTIFPRCLERLTIALENCEASFAYSYLEKFGENSCIQNGIWDPKKLQLGNTIDAMVLLRKDVWESVNGYTKMEVMGWEDFDLWFKIARKKGWGALVPEILCRYRVHRSSMLSTTTNLKTTRLWTILHNSYPEFFTNDIETLVANKYQEIGDLYNQIRDWDKAIDAYENALKILPFNLSLSENILRAYTNAGRLDDFTFMFTEIIENNPSWAPKLVSSFYDELGSTLEILERLILHDPENPMLLKAKTQSLFRIGELDRALSCANDARNCYIQYQQKIDEAMEKGNITEAWHLVDSWDQDETDKPNPFVMVYKARLLMAFNKPGESLSTYSSMLSHMSSDIDFLAEYLNAALTVGNRATGIKLVEKMLLLEPTNHYIDTIRKLTSKWPDFLALQLLSNSFTPVVSSDENDPKLILEMILSSDNIFQAVIDNKKHLTPELLKLIQYNSRIALSEGNHELAEGLDELVGFISSMLANSDSKKQ